MPLTADPDVEPVAERGVAVAAERAVTEPIVISPPKSEIPDTWTEALAVVFAAPATPDTVVVIEATLAIDPSPGNANPPPPEPFGGACAYPPVALPRPGADTEIPNASALGAPTPTAEGAPALPEDPVSARTPRMPSRSECRRITVPDYWQRPRPLLDPIDESENHYHLGGATAEQG
jgi:hypothetical protein